MSKEQRQDIHNSEIPLVCRSCEARHGGVCGILAPEQLVELSKHTKRTAHARDVSLADAMGDPDNCSNILSGVVKLTKLMKDGRQQIVGLQFAPDFLGQPFARDDKLQTEAATDVRLCSFPRSVINSFVEENPEIEHRLHEQHSRELDEARDWMLTLGRKNATEKVASFILMLVNHIEPEHDGKISELEIALPLKRADIADFLGLTIETVSRQVTNLRKLGVIDVNDRKSIVVLNPERLERIAEGE